MGQILFGLAIGFLCGICFTASMGARVVTEGKNGQPNTVRFKETTYVLVKAKIEEYK